MTRPLPFDRLSEADKNLIIAEIFALAAMIALADAKRHEGWLSAVWAAADAARRGATQAYASCLAWSRLGKTFNQRDFDRVWEDYDPDRADGISIATLFRLAGERACYDADARIAGLLTDAADGVAETMPRAEPGRPAEGMLKGYLAWLRDGLAPPKAVVRATEDYLIDEDSIGAWIAERCELGTDKYASLHDLYSSWKLWAEQYGEHPGKQKELAGILDTREKLTRHRQGGTGRTGWVGIEVKQNIEYDKGEWLAPAESLKGARRPARHDPPRGNEADI
jgi:hypothetical protein